MLKKKFKQHLYVNPGSLGEAADYYVESFGSIKKKGFFFPHCIELFVADTTLVLSEGIKDPARYMILSFDHICFPFVFRYNH